MLALDLALKNLKGAGLRTWLNVIVLSFSYVLIIWSQGIYVGMGEQISRAMIDSEIGGGQYWCAKYDPYDPLTLDDSHAPVPSELQGLIKIGKTTPILIRQAAVYAGGRMRTVLMKGIDPGQSVLDLPATGLATETETLPVLIGRRMARSTGLKNGDYFTVRWRDARGAFDAVDGRVVVVMETPVESVDSNHIWVPLDKMRKMTGMPGEATIIVNSKEITDGAVIPGWNFKGYDLLLEEIRALVKAKSTGGSIMYVFLLLLAAIAIFDTQILAIFRRRKEIGTMIAMGMTRANVVALFTFEGAMYGVLAALLGAVYGIPLIALTAVKGIPLADAYGDMGFALGTRLYPQYSALLVIGTIILVMTTVTFVSYLPSRKISKMNPTDAIRGKTS
ncbi:MAG: FtsX-like permease family protein [Candidatus Margulisiibacteriota bacterium]